MRRASTAFALAALLRAAAAGGADDLSVEARRRGAAVEITAHATLHAPPDLVWRTLTDYDRLPQFIPGMRRSRLVERRGDLAVVEQAGEARLLFFVFPIEVLLVALERPPVAIDVRMVRGTLRRLEGGYRIEPGGRDGTLTLRWQGLVEPGEALPPLLGEAVMRANIADQFGGMVSEIERREALRRAATGAAREPR